MMEHASGSTFFDQLLKGSRAPKKQVSLYLDEAKVERIELISRLFSSISDSKVFSRNTLIETAIDKFMNESEAYLLSEHGIDVSQLLMEARFEKYDTVLLTSKETGFEETFLGMDEPACWYPCRIAPEREAHLKYITIYRAHPVAAITHYAKIKEFRYDAERQCKVCQVDGEPIELPHKIPLSRSGKYVFVGTKYTTLESLLSAERTDDIHFDS